MHMVTPTHIQQGLPSLDPYSFPPPSPILVSVRPSSTTATLHTPDKGRGTTDQPANTTVLATRKTLVGSDAEIAGYDGGKKSRRGGWAPTTSLQILGNSNTTLRERQSRKHGEQTCTSTGYEEEGVYSRARSSTQQCELNGTEPPTRLGKPQPPTGLDRTPSPTTKPAASPEPAPAADTTPHPHPHAPVIASRVMTPETRVAGGAGTKKIARWSVAGKSTMTGGSSGGRGSVDGLPATAGRSGGGCLFCPPATILVAVPFLAPPPADGFCTKPSGRRFGSPVAGPVDLLCPMLLL